MSEDKINALQAEVEQDPNDELAQFSLGSALLDAGRAEEAGPCLQRVLAINSQHSKAYELLGKTQKQCGLNDLAIQTLTNGIRVAHRRGDLMPKEAMSALLQELGAEIPSFDAPVTKTDREVSGDGSFSCRRCGGSGPELEKAPFKGDLAETIQQTVCTACWQEWVGQGTKVINELRLLMYEPQSQELYDRHMKEFLLID